MNGPPRLSRRAGNRVPRTLVLVLIASLLLVPAMTSAIAAKGGSGRGGQGKGNTDPREYTVAPSFETWYWWRTCEGMLLGGCPGDPEYSGGRLEANGAFNLWSRTSMVDTTRDSQSGYDAYTGIALGELSKVEVIAVINLTSFVVDARTFPVASEATIEFGLTLDSASCDPCPTMTFVRSADSILGPVYQAGDLTIELRTSFTATEGQKLPPTRYDVRQWLTLTALSAATIEEPIEAGQAEALASGQVESVVVVAYP